jgi:hypothetical protein
LEFYGHGWFDATDIRIYMSTRNELSKTAERDRKKAQSKAERLKKIKEIQKAAEERAAKLTPPVSQSTHHVPKTISTIKNPTGGYWQLVEEKGNIGRECTRKEMNSDYYRDTISGFGSHIKITQMIRETGHVYCKTEAEWRRPAEKLYPGDTIKFPVTINRLLDTGELTCELRIYFDLHDMECGGTGGGGKIGGVTLHPKSQNSIHKTILWKVKEAFLKKKGERMTIRVCYSGVSICGKNRGMKYYYEWVPDTLRGKDDPNISGSTRRDMDPNEKSIEDAKKEVLIAKIREIQKEAAEKEALVERMEKVRKITEKAKKIEEEKARKAKLSAEIQKIREEAKKAALSKRIHEIEEAARERAAAAKHPVSSVGHRVADIESESLSINEQYVQGFSGKWNSTFGVMKLSVKGSHISGNYTHDKGRISATLSKDGKTMKGTWAEAPSYSGSVDAGKMYFKLNSGGDKIVGLWGYGNKKPTRTWNATRIKSVKK